MTTPNLVRIGIDQSYTKCAYTIFTDSSLTDFGIFTSDPSTDPFQRSLAIALEIVNLYKKWRPSCINIEGLAFGMRGNATRDLAGLLFTIINITHLHESSAKFEIVAPTSVKKLATGSGKAKKKDMVDALPVEVRDRFKDAGYKTTTGLTDLADAYWIGSFAK